jgi:hypothetical protein
VGIGGDLIATLSLEHEASLLPRRVGTHGMSLLVGDFDALNMTIL